MRTPIVVSFALLAAGCSSAALGQQFTISAGQVYDGVNFTYGNSYTGPIGDFDYGGSVNDGGYDAFDGFMEYYQSLGGLTLHRRVESLFAINTYRAIDTFTNNTAGALSVPFTLHGNLGSDGSEVFYQNNIYSSVTSDTSLQFNFGDPVVGFMNGNNAWTTANILRNHSFDNIYTNFTINLQPGQSVSLMFAAFLALDLTNRSGDAALAVGTVNAMLADPSATGLFAGLTQGEINSIVNWSVPTPGAAALLGLGGLASLRRRRPASA